MLETLKLNLGDEITLGFLIRFNQIKSDQIIKSPFNSKWADQLVVTKSIKTDSLNVEFNQKWSIVLNNG